MKVEYIVKTTTFSYFLECPPDEFLEKSKGVGMAVCKNLVSAVGPSAKFINAATIAENADKAGLPVFWALYNEFMQVFNDLEVSQVIVYNFFDSVFSGSGKNYPMSKLERIYLISILKMVNFAIVNMGRPCSIAEFAANIDPMSAKVIDFPEITFDLVSGYFVDLTKKLEALEDTVESQVSQYYSTIRLYAKVGQFICPAAWKITSETKFVGTPEKYCYIGVGVHDFMKALHDKKFAKSFPECLTAESLADALAEGRIFIAPGTTLAASLFKDLPQRKI